MATTLRQELTARIAMLTDAIALCEAEGEDATRQHEVRADYQAELGRLGDGDGSVRNDAAPEAKPISARPAGGARAANQYGVSQVHYSTPKQVAFLKSLLERKDLGKLRDADAVKAQVAAGQINKKAASAAIDILLGSADKPATPGTPAGRPASDKQIALIKRLAAERQLSDEDRAKTLAALGTLSPKGASTTIDKLFALPRAPVAATHAVEAGMYVAPDGRIFRAYLGQQSGQILCKEVVLVTEATSTEPAEYELEYRGRADRFITADFRRMGLDEAKAWGKTTSTCCVCARRLDVPESVDAGIGPKCAKGFA